MPWYVMMKGQQQGGNIVASSGDAILSLNFEVLIVVLNRKSSVSEGIRHLFPMKPSLLNSIVGLCSRGQSFVSLLRRGLLFCDLQARLALTRPFWTIREGISKLPFC